MFGTMSSRPMVFWPALVRLVGDAISGGTLCVLDPPYDAAPHLPLTVMCLSDASIITSLIVTP
jgi:hypothetical protein